MNGTAKTNADLAAWQDMLERPGTLPLFLAALLYILSAFTVPFSDVMPVAVCLMVLCGVFFFFQTGSLFSIFLPGLPALLLYLVSGGASLPACFLAIVFGGAAGAILLTFADRPWHLALLSLVPAALSLVALFISRDPLQSLLTLLPLPVAVAGSVTIRRRISFFPAVALLATALGVTLTVAAVVVLAERNLLDVAYIGEFATLLEGEILAARDQVIAEFTQGTASSLITPEVIGELTAVLSDTAIHNAVAIVINATPGLFAALCLIVCYYLWRILTVLLVSFGCLPRVPATFERAEMSLVSAILFLLSLLVSFFAGGASSMVGTVTLNFVLLLMPAFCFIGFGALFDRSAPRSCLSVLLLIGILVLLVNNPPAALTIAAVYGAIYSMIPANRKGDKTNQQQ